MPVIKEKNITTEDSNSLKSNHTLTSARVLDVILDINHPKAKEHGEYDAIGTIFFSILDKNDHYQNKNSSDHAKPLFSHLKYYPLINEVVLILSANDKGIYGKKSSKSFYYLPQINLWNHPHHNALPTSKALEDEPTSNDYQKRDNGITRKVTDEGTDIVLGRYFKEQLNIKPLLSYEGDRIFEGRFGNSIRFGSTNKNKNQWSRVGDEGDPITIIRNGHNTGINDEGWKPTTENTYEDHTSIYLTHNQQITGFSPASLNQQSFGANLTEPQKYIIPTEEEIIEEEVIEEEIIEEEGMCNNNKLFPPAMKALQGQSFTGEGSGPTYNSSTTQAQFRAKIKLNRALSDNGFPEGGKYTLRADVNYSIDRSSKWTKRREENISTYTITILNCDGTPVASTDSEELPETERKGRDLKRKEFVLKLFGDEEWKYFYPGMDDTFENIHYITPDKLLEIMDFYDVKVMHNNAWYMKFMGSPTGIRGDIRPHYNPVNNSIHIPTLEVLIKRSKKYWEENKDETWWKEQTEDYHIRYARHIQLDSVWAEVSHKADFEKHGYGGLSRDLIDDVKSFFGRKDIEWRYTNEQHFEGRTHGVTEFEMAQDFNIHTDSNEFFAYLEEKRNQTQV